MNKRGFLRIIEASISILIIAGVLFIFLNQQRAEVQEGLDVAEFGRDILEELSKRDDLRRKVLTSPNGDVPEVITDFIGNRLPTYLNFDARICEIDENCGIDFIEGNVYSAERSISYTLTDEGPKKIRLFIWEPVTG